MKTVLIVLAVIIVLIFALYLLIRYEINKVKSKIRTATNGAFGNGSFSQDYNKILQQTSETPKSVHGMTNIYLPLIAKDFPDFAYDEFKARAINAVESAFAAISANDVGKLSESGRDLKEKVSAIINSNVANGVRENYSSVKQHSCEISMYKRAAGRCTVTIQCAMEYFYTKKKAGGELVEGNEQLKHQARYNVEVMYIQNAEIAGKFDSSSDTVSLNCPNCGAPITNLGAKHCEYCGTAVQEINIHMWSVNNYTEV